MKYKTKKEAEQAAKDYAWDRIRDGRIVAEERRFKNSINIGWVESMAGGSSGCRHFEYEPHPKIAKDTPVWVRNKPWDNWVKRHATGRVDNFCHVECYDDGMTSFTSQVERGYFWPEYSITDPTK